MPSLPPLRCKIRTCPISHRNRSGYCAEHEKQYKKQFDIERGSASERGYDANWIKVRKMKLARQPLCEQCYQTNIIKSAQMVHHIDGNSRNRKPNNLMSLCNDCHEKISYQQGRRWKRKS